MLVFLVSVLDLCSYVFLPYLSEKLVNVISGIGMFAIVCVGNFISCGLGINCRALADYGSLIHLPLFADRLRWHWHPEGGGFLKVQAYPC